MTTRLVRGVSLALVAAVYVGCGGSTASSGSDPDDAGGPSSGTPGRADAGISTGTGSASGSPSVSGSGGLSGTGSGGASSTGSGGASSTGGSSIAGTGGAAAGSGGSSGSAGSPGGGPQAGLLTAGSIDDNLNFGWYLNYLKRSETQAIAGLPLIPRDDRLQVAVLDMSGAPVAGASVTISTLEHPVLAAPTRGDGFLFFFPGAAGASPGTDLQVTARLGSDMAMAAAKVGDDKVTIRLMATRAAPAAALDLALVIDTTGSMGDELQYLNVEMSNIVAQIKDAFPNVSQRWALIVYRDSGDEYVVRTFDFTDSLATFQNTIAAQSAGGGGDYPEAPDRALVAANNLSWRGEPGSDTRMMFWVADAPHHFGREATMVSAIQDAQKLGIRIHPVAASGADELVEYTMRTAAQVTGGRYLFLTNDSGVGVAQGHIEPTIAPCYFITALNKAMVRMVKMELTGQHILPASTEILRTAGSPDVDGQCALSGGQNVTVF